MSQVKEDAVVLKEVGAKTADMVATAAAAAVMVDKEMDMVAKADTAATEEVAATDLVRTTRLQDEAAPLSPP